MKYPLSSRNDAPNTFHFKRDLDLQEYFIKSKLGPDNLMKYTLISRTDLRS